MKNVVELKKLYNDIGNAEKNDTEKYVGIKGETDGDNWQIVINAQSKSMIIDNHEKYKEALFALADAACYLDFIEKNHNPEVHAIECENDSEDKAYENYSDFNFSFEPYILVKENTAKVINPYDEDGDIIEVNAETEILRDYVALWFSWDRGDIWRTRMFYVSIEDLHEFAKKYNVKEFQNITFDEIYELVHSRNVDSYLYDNKYTPNLEDFYNEEVKKMEKTK